MRKIMLVMRYEIRKTLRSAGYVIFAFVIPVVAVLVLAVINLLGGRSGGEGGGTATGAPSQFDMEVEGYVDQSRLIRVIPDNIPPGHLLRFENEQAAQQALASGEITAYYVIPPDYIERGEVYYVYPDTRSYLDDGQSWVISWTLTANLVEGDGKLADMVWNPAWNVEVTRVSSQVQAGVPVGEDCSRPGFACESYSLIRYMPAIMVALFYVAFMVSSSMLFNSIGTEKENRVIEVLMSSISPQQLLAGKTLGLGITGLLQTIIWLGSIYICLRVGGTILSLPSDFTFPVDILIWSIVFFLGGYGLYASLMAGAGALVPKMKEAGVANFIAMIPLFIGYMVGLLAPIAGVSQATLPIALSIFPLTAPVVMVMRLSDGSVPLWQLLLSAALTFATAWWTLHAAAKLFHAQNLLSGQPFSLKSYLGMMIGRQ